MMEATLSQPQLVCCVTVELWRSILFVANIVPWDGERDTDTSVEIQV